MVESIACPVLRGYLESVRGENFLFDASDPLFVDVVNAAKGETYNQERSCLRGFVAWEKAFIAVALRNHDLTSVFCGDDGSARRPTHISDLQFVEKDLPPWLAHLEKQIDSVRIAKLEFALASEEVRRGGEQVQQQKLDRWLTAADRVKSYAECLAPLLRGEEQYCERMAILLAFVTKTLNLRFSVRIQAAELLLKVSAP